MRDGRGVGEMPAERARARHGAEQAVQMPRDGVQPRALRQFALDIGHERHRGRLRRGKAGGFAKDQRIDGEEPPRLLIGGAAHHHAVDMVQMRKRRLDAADAAVENDGEPRMRAFEPIDAIVIERRNFAVFLRRQTFEPGFARMHDERIGARALDRLRKNFERRFRILVVDADAAFDRDRDRHRRLHRGDAIADQCRLRHQAGAEAAVLHAVGRTTGIEIDLVKAEVGADARACGERARVRAAKLQRHRMLGRIVTQQPRPIAMQHRAGGEHFGIEQRAARQQAMEEPAMPVGPFHHRSDGKAAVKLQCGIPTFSFVYVALRR